MVRNKRGERERREVREGEHTGGQWDRESSTLVVIRDGGCWRRLVVAVHGGGRWRRFLVIISFRSPLPSFATVRRAPLSVVLSYPSRIVELFGVAGLAFGIG